MTSRGRSVPSPAATRPSAPRIAEFFARPPVAADPVAFPQLTRHEREILELVTAGRSNGDLAEHLFLSPKTVRNNVSNIFAKLQVSGRTEAVFAARDAGLGRGGARG